MVGVVVVFLVISNVPSKLIFSLIVRTLFYVSIPRPKFKSSCVVPNGQEREKTNSNTINFSFPRQGVMLRYD